MPGVPSYLAAADSHTTERQTVTRQIITQRNAHAALVAGRGHAHDHFVRHVRGHDEVVLHNEGGLARVEDEALDHARGDETLLGVEVAAGGGV